MFSHLPFSTFQTSCVLTHSIFSHLLCVHTIYPFQRTMFSHFLCFNPFCNFTPLCFQTLQIFALYVYLLTPCICSHLPFHMFYVFSPFMFHIFYDFTPSMFSHLEYFLTLFLDSFHSLQCPGDLSLVYCVLVMWADSFPVRPHLLSPLIL